MALSATIHRCDLQISDLERNYYNTHALTVARHPSETTERMMVRILAFALNAAEDLAFTRGLSQDDEPDLWQHDLSGGILRWIEIGQPDGKRIRKASGRSRQVIIYGHQHRAMTVWWQQNEAKLDRFSNVAVYRLPDGIGEQLTGLAERNMRLQCTIQEEEIWFSDDKITLNFCVERLC